MALTYGKVIGKFVTVRGDGTDTDRLPDIIGATNTRITFTPDLAAFPTEELGALATADPQVCTVSETGDMLDAQEQVGVWLLTGTYTVSGHALLSKIVVTAGHTDEAPLDLWTAVNYTPPTGTTVQTVVVPSGAANGQILGWVSGGLAWVDGGAGGEGPEGPPGEDGADGASAYEVAVSEGFVGTETEWLASLVGPEGPAGEDGADGAQGIQGEPGVDGADGDSAYEVAVADGFVGDEAAWLASLVGPKGDTGDQGPPGEDGADGADSTVPGPDGDSAYQVWLDNGNTGSEQDFLDSLVGPAGQDGEDGATGPAGTTTWAGITDKPTDLVTGDGISQIVALTQAAYDGITPDPSTLYVITD